jgi:hypothetical protein
MRDGVFSDGPGSPLWIGALPRPRGFSHEVRLLSIAKSRVPRGGYSVNLARRISATWTRRAGA